MVVRRGKKKTFNGKSYREVQRANSDRRKQLRQADQQWLKENKFRNVGWDNVIHLYNKIEEFLEQYRLEELSLEELFLEADRIGNKYLTTQEIEDFNQRLAQEISEIETVIDKHFPDEEMEVIDFNESHSHKLRRRTKR
ncbi:MAG TPA: hypothetical protein IGS37_02255 [Synechococcales cyanobacterium M55_K2018_004]|nr:hypothetical protein [Synechococcales cyanobacterium M55_K2018_004]